MFFDSPFPLSYHHSIFFLGRESLCNIPIANQVKIHNVVLNCAGLYMGNIIRRIQKKRKKEMRNLV